MIHWSQIFRLLGFIILAIAISMMPALIFARVAGDEGVRPLLWPIIISAVIGTFLFWFFRSAHEELTRREGILTVVAAWIAASLLGSLPFYFSGYFPTFTDALFESISGFTTTGATVLPDVERLPHSILFWRSFTHWIGGMGTILLGIAILPLVGVGTQLYRAEFSGARSERLTPRIAETARALWKIYVVLSLAGYVSLRWAGMGKFDAVCHMFGTVGTGAFSTRNLSVGAFGSPLIELIIVFFMVLAAMNFTRHYRLFIEGHPRAFFGDVEIQSYLLLLGGTTVAIALSISYSLGMPMGESLRQSLFQVASIMTTTGFSSVDFEKWTSFAQLLLLASMFAGGCTGSTAGGLKTARLVLLMHVVRREFHRMAEPRAVFTIRLRNQTVSEHTIQSLLNLVYLAFLVNFAGVILLTLAGNDILTAITAVAAAMFNIGPGLGLVGPAENYGHMHPLAKWVLSVIMLAGRLEFYTLLVLFAPAFWKK